MTTLYDLVNAKSARTMGPGGEGIAREAIAIAVLLSNATAGRQALSRGRAVLRED
jgi:hypothetical protein